jgi:hypothetical protein
MKIHQLPQGARFEYEGEEYVKTGPMFGTGKGGQRFIPKYAVLKPLGEAGDARDRTQHDSVSKANVLTAFETFYAECRRRVPDDQQLALDAARDRFLQALD